MMQLAGQDATQQFYALHKASVLQKFAKKLCIGTLLGSLRCLTSAAIPHPSPTFPLSSALFPLSCSDEQVANRDVRDFGRDRHEAISRRPPISLHMVVARTGRYTHAAKVWDLSIVKGPFSVAPCQTLGLMFTIRNLCIAVCRRVGGGGQRRPARGAGAHHRHEPGETFAATGFHYGDLGFKGRKGRGRVRIQVHCVSGPCHPPQVGGRSVLLLILRAFLKSLCY
jgi:hypothetical protein